MLPPVSSFVPPALALPATPAPVAPPRSEKRPGLSPEPQATSCGRQAEIKVTTEKPRTNFIVAPKNGDARPQAGDALLVVTEWRLGQANHRENDARRRPKRRIRRRRAPTFRADVGTEAASARQFTSI